MLRHGLGTYPRFSALMADAPNARSEDDSAAPAINASMRAQNTGDGQRFRDSH